VGWGSEKRECRYKQTLIFHIVFFFTESWGTVVRFREKKNLVLNYGNILWNCAVFSIIFFLAKKLPKNAENLSHIFFLHIVACFCSFLFHRVISGGFFSCHQIILTFAVCFFRREIGVGKLEPSTFFFGCPKIRTYIFCLFVFLVVFSTIFSMHTCKYASKNLKRVNFVFFAVFVQIKGK